MNFRTTTILAIAVLGVAALAFFALKDGSETPKPASTAVGKLFDAKADAFDHLTIRSDSGQEVQLARTGMQWKVVAPVEWPADSTAVNGLLGAIIELHTRGQIDLDSANTTATGMDHPRLVITASGQKTLKLEIGKDSPLGNDIYVRANDSKHADQVPAGSLRGQLADGVEKLVDSLRDKKLVSVADAAVNQIEITNHGARLAVARVPAPASGAPGPKWALTEPVHMNAETPDVDSLLTLVTGLSAAHFASEAEAQTGGAHFDKPRLTISLSPTTPPGGAGSSTHSGGTVVIIGEAVDIEAQKTWVKVTSPDRPTVVAQASLNATQFEQLSKASALTLRDKDVLELDPEKVARFTVSIRKPKPVPATTQASPATTQAAAPMDVREFTIERRPPPETQPASATTQSATAPSTGPATRPAVASTQPAPSTQPATQPAAKSVWIFASGVNADDDQVVALLKSFNKLRVEKYVEPGTVSGAIYTITLEERPSGAAAGARHLITFTVTGTNVVGKYEDATFELSESAGRDLLAKLNDDFKTARPPPPPPPSLPEPSPMRPPFSLPPGHPPLGRPPEE